MEKYNIVVIGGGSGGLMVAAGAAGLGARVALVERGRMGGDCLNYGCIPSKALIGSAATAAAIRAGGRGIAPGSPSFSWPKVAARVQAAIDAIAPHDSPERFRSLGVEVLEGSGRLRSRGSVEVQLNGGGTRSLESRAIVIATGSAPAVPPVAGLEEAGYLTNETVFTIQSQPKRLLILGGGAIGVELGQSFARLGSEVTLIEMLPRILPRDDPEAAQVVAEALARDGVRIVTGHRVSRVERVAKGKLPLLGQSGSKRVFYRPEPPAGGGGGHAADSPADSPELTIEVDEILVATGRRLNTEGLGLENAGVDHDSRGISVNDRMQTTARSVYACGDVVGSHLFTHAANQQARVVIQNALLPFKTRMDSRVMPRCTFSNPELAQVGLSELDARERGVAHRVIRVPFTGNDRAVCEDDTVGFLKVLTPPGRDDILGATLVGAHAGETIHEIVLAMQARIGLKSIAKMVHAYPTRAEIFRRAADESRKAAFTPTIQRLFGAYLRWRRH